MQTPSQQVPNLDGFELPPPEESLVRAKQRLAQTLRHDEMVWLVAERYEPAMPSWTLDVVRQGALGRWVRQRQRFDTQAEVLYYMGESALSDTEFRDVRRSAALFPVAEWKAQEF